MAYGKNDSNLNKVAPYGGNLSQRAQRVRQSKESGFSGSKGGGRPYWVNTFKCPQDHSRIGRLIPGAYEQTLIIDGDIVTDEYEYVMYSEHFEGVSKRGGICSAGAYYREAMFGDPNKAEPCYGCQIWREDYEVRKQKKASGDKTKGPNRISRRDMFAWTWWDYGAWYKVDRTDERGAPVLNQNTGEPYYDWVMGQPNDPTYSHCTCKYGHLLAWPMGETYHDALLDYNCEQISSDCATCGSVGTIKSIMRTCGNPECGNVIYMADETTLTPEQQKKIEVEPYTCPICKQTGPTEEVISCDVCMSRNLTCKRATIFDVDIEVKAQGTKGQQTFLHILSRSAPQAIQVQDPEILKAIKPLNLLRQYSPTPYEHQQKIWSSSTTGSAPSPHGVRSAVHPAQQNPMMPSMMGPGLKVPLPPQQQYQSYEDE